ALAREDDGLLGLGVDIADDPGSAGDPGSGASAGSDFQKVTTSRLPVSGLCHAFPPGSGVRWPSGNQPRPLQVSREAGIRPCRVDPILTKALPSSAAASRRDRDSAAPVNLTSRCW